MKADFCASGIVGIVFLLFAGLGFIPDYRRLRAPLLRP